MTDAPDKPVVLVDTTVNGVPTAAPTRKVLYGGIYGVITAIIIQLAKKAFPAFSDYLDDPSVTATIVDALAQAAPAIVGSIAAYFTRNAKT